MAFNKKKIITCILLAPVILYIAYHDLYLMSGVGDKSIAEKAVRDAILSSGREDLELSQISGYHCNFLNHRQRENKVRTYRCSASAVFADGTSAKVSIQKKEYTRTHYNHGSKHTNVYKIEFTATIHDPGHGLGPDIQGSSSITSVIGAFL